MGAAPGADMTARMLGVGPETTYQHGVVTAQGPFMPRVWTKSGEVWVRGRKAFPEFEDLQEGGTSASCAVTVPPVVDETGSECAGAD